MPRSPLFVSAPRWRWLAPVAGLILLFHWSGIGLTLDRAFLDGATQQPWRAPELDAKRSALVLIDETTMARAKTEGYGARWPFPRFSFAGLLAALHRAGAAQIVVDFTFFDPSDALEQDVLLAGVAAAIPGTVLARTPEQPPFFWNEQFVADHPSAFEQPRTGNVLLNADTDGVVRRYEVNGSLAGAATSSSEPAGSRLLRWHGGLDELRRKGVPVLSAAPFFSDGLAVVDPLLEAAVGYGETATEDAEPQLNLPALRAALSALPRRDDALAAAVSGRTVFLGASAAGTFDAKTFPIGGIEPGVVLHWTAWSNLNGSGFLREVPRSATLALGALFVGLLASIGTDRGELRRAGVLAALLAGGTFAASYLVFGYGWYLPPATPMAATLLAFTGVAAEGLWTEHRRRREIQTIFGSYVDPGVVERLVRDPNAVRLGGERREATVFFCDLAGFTDLSEQVSPEQLIELINRYLQDTSECLSRHGAYIDKYIGDAVMAVFGAPQEQSDHAIAAGRAALATQRALVRLNEELAASFGRTLQLRIGLNTGDMIVGNVGSSQKLNYTVLGDAVNLASRLEGANKEFGTSILVGEKTAAQIGEHLVLRPVARLRVKGKQTAVLVSELCGSPTELAPEQLEFVRRYCDAYHQYSRRQFGEAAQGFAAALELRPDDRLSRALMADAQRLTQTAPPADWEPTVSLSSK